MAYTISINIDSDKGYFININIWPLVQYLYQDQYSEMPYSISIYVDIDICKYLIINIDIHQIAYAISMSISICIDID